MFDNIDMMARIEREIETIPSTRAPYHVWLRLKVDASKRARASGARLREQYGVSV